MICPAKPARPDEQPILLYQQEPGDYRAVAAGVVIGSVSRYHVDSGETRWLWYLTDPRNSNQDDVRHGDCETLLLAKEALRSSLQSRRQSVSPLNSTIERDDCQMEKE